MPGNTLFIFSFAIIGSFYLFIYLTSPTAAGSPQQLMPITVGPHYLTHPVKFSDHKAFSSSTLFPNRGVQISPYFRS